MRNITDNMELLYSASEIRERVKALGTLISKKYEIVINCLENEKQANRYIKKLKNKNYNPTFSLNEIGNCYIIKLGLFFEKNEAIKYLKKIQSEITEDAWIYISMK